MELYDKKPGFKIKMIPVNIIFSETNDYEPTFQLLDVDGAFVIVRLENKKAFYEAYLNLFDAQEALEELGVDEDDVNKAVREYCGLDN